MTEQEFAVLYAEYFTKRRVIQAMARKLAKNDPDLYDDLVQVGLFTLYRLDVSKAKTNKDSWIRQAMKFKMIDELAQADPRKYVSLDQRLEQGYQLEETVDGVRLTAAPVHALKAPITESAPSEYEVVSEEWVDASDT